MRAGSLFPDPGLLELDFGTDAVELPCVDATTIELSETFGARLVRNDEPFRITDVELASKDEYRPVSCVQPSLCLCAGVRMTLCSTTMHGA